MRSPRTGIDACPASRLSVAALFVWAASVLTAPEADADGTWSRSGRLLVPRSWHNMTLLRDGKVLIVGGHTTASAEIYDPSTGTSTATTPPAGTHFDNTATLLPNGLVLFVGGWTELYDPSTSQWHYSIGQIGGRWRHTATLLHDGTVLVVGGESGPGDPLSSAVLFDPVTETFSSAGMLTEGRKNHTATRLPDGRVLIAGGEDADGPVLGCEIYDPATDQWTAADELLTAHTEGTATLLSSGKVLIAGGWDVADFSSYSSAAQLYDPDLDTWTGTGPLATARARHIATLLPSGKVLVATGLSGLTLNSAELYDPISGTWSATDSLEEARTGARAVLTAQGQVLITGGGLITHTETYTPDHSTWTTTDPPPSTRWRHTATLLPNGRVFVTGGYYYAPSADTYDPATGTWTTATAPAGRDYATATLLHNGKVLIAGGEDADFAYQNSALLYDYTNGTWSATGSMSTARAGHTATLLSDGRVLVTGGGTPVCEIYDPASGSWTMTAATNGQRFFSTATLLADGRVLAVGGSIEFQNEIYDPRTETWTPTGPPVTARSLHTATLLHNGKVLVVGGSSGQGVFATAEIYDPATNQWSAAGSLAQGRYEHEATLLPNGRVLVTGGNSTTELDSVEEFDPYSETWQTRTPMPAAASGHTATLLPSGAVLIVGGILNAASLYEPQYAAPRPAITTSTASISYSSPLEITGTDFAADEETGGGNHGASATNYPIVVISSIESGLTAVLTPDPPDPLTDFFADPMTLTISDLPANLDPGWQRLNVITNGVVSETAIVFLQCSTPFIGNGPDDQWAAIDGTATFAVATRAARGFQWLRDGEPIPGANASSYTTPKITALDAGARYSVILYGSCADITSGEAVLRVLDNIPPSVSVTSPIGGEYWLLSEGTSVSSAASLAVFSATTATPFCAAVASACDSGSLLTGRGSISGGVEPNQPNTIGGTCADGNSGTFHNDESIDRIVIRTADGGAFAPGKLAEIEVTFWAYADFSADVLEIFIAPDAASPVWQRIDAHTPTAAGTVVHTATFVIPAGASRQAVRARLRYLGAPGNSACYPGGFNDHDDVVFTVGSSADTVTRTEIAAWSMSDDVRVCRVETALLYSNDGGATYGEPAGGGGFRRTFGSGGLCAYPGEATANTTFTIPTEFPSGRAGSLYKMRVTVTDHAGNSTTALSPNPFYIVKANPDSVRTLLLWNRARMIAAQGITESQAEAVAVKLLEVANHPRVQGLVVDLSNVTSVNALYAAWDADPDDASKANDVLFGSGGIHAYLRTNLLPAYGGVKYLVLVGDDRIIPMARVQDNTALLPESNYANGTDLSPVATTVGQALAAEQYLSDDPLTVFDAVTDLDGNLYLPDLSVGRLVETPADIITTIATYIGQDGILDLSDPDLTHKVLVTGYDFLSGVAREMRSRWKSALGDGSGDASIAPVDGSLIGGSWGLPSVTARSAALRGRLAGNGGDRYGVMALAGHATHYEEGVPGTNPFDINGLSTADLYGPDACSTPSAGAVDLAGGVIYAVGCHGGLPVPGTCRTDASRSLDLPQTLLARGAVAYVANSGYGWSLKNAIGYGARLVQIFTEQLTTGGTVVVGDAVRESKHRYYLESPRFDDYDEKTVMQWTLFGLPMYAIRTGISASATIGAAERGAAGISEERQGDVRIRRSAPQESARALHALPSSLTQLNLSFDLTAGGVYQKRDSEGYVLPSGPGCPDANGCYYTLNGLVDRGTGSADLPIEPYLIYDSRLAGTSQHGVLWKGGTYDEESGWIPLIAEIISNGNSGSNHGAAPRLLTPRPTGPRVVLGTDPVDCRPSDLELNSLTITAGEAVKPANEDLTWSINRRYRTVDVEVFYFNDRNAPTANCDRTGPVLGAPPFGGAYHQVSNGPGSSTVNWSVPVTDAAGVWRVLVVYNTNLVDGQSRGTWVPLELTSNGSGAFNGSVILTGTSRVTYVIEAVDNRGNVTWLDFTSASLPSSGIPLGVPRPVDVGVGAIPPPASLVATAASATSVSLTWYAVDAATSYDVYRRSTGTGLVKIASSSTPAYTDPFASASTAYLYAVKAVDASNAASGFSNVDLATTVFFTDATLVAGTTPVRAAHVSELRNAVAAVRTLAGLGSFTYTDPTLIPGATPVRRAHITDLRTALDAARSTLALTALSYTDASPPALTIVKSAHVAELRDGVK